MVEFLIANGYGNAVWALYALWPLSPVWGPR